MKSQLVIKTCDNKRRPYLLNDECFSLWGLCKYTGAKYLYVKYHIDRGVDISTAINESINTPFNYGSLRGSTTTYKGEEYPSRSAFAKALDIDPHLFGRCVLQGLTVEQAVEYVSAAQKKQKDKIDRYKYKGGEYTSKHKLAVATGANEVELKRLLSEGVDVDEAVALAVKKQNELDNPTPAYTYQEHSFNSVTSFANFSKVSSYLLRECLRKHDAVEDAVNEAISRSRRND